MKSQKPATALTNLVVTSIFFAIASILLINGMLASGSAQAPKERELDDQIPKHVPIRIKIRKEKEKAFKDPTNEHWFRDMEIEVKNTGEKPIYFLHLNVSMPEAIAPNGLVYGTPVYYGRTSLSPLSAPVTPEDVPIKPGETVILKIRDYWVKGWESFARDEYKDKPQPLRVRVIIQHLNFGDGTGMSGSSGTPMPRPQSKLTDY